MTQTDSNTGAADRESVHALSIAREVLVDDLARRSNLGELR